MPPRPGDRWFADETYVKVAGQWTYLYRAVDRHGQVIDVLLSARRDLAGSAAVLRHGDGAGRSRWRSQPTVRPFTRGCSMSWCPGIARR